MQRYQDFSMPPVACDRRSKEERTSGTLATPASRDWQSCPELAWGWIWQARWPDAQPILTERTADSSNQAAAVVSWVPELIFSSSLAKQRQIERQKEEGGLCKTGEMAGACQMKASKSALKSTHTFSLSPFLPLWLCVYTLPAGSVAAQCTLYLTLWHGIYKGQWEGEERENKNWDVQMLSLVSLSVTSNAEARRIEVHEAQEGGGEKI